jgi:hypothetical protein
MRRPMQKSMAIEPYKTQCREARQTDNDGGISAKRVLFPVKRQSMPVS